MQTAASPTSARLDETLPTLDPSPARPIATAAPALAVAARTDLGKSRSRNEDSYVVARLGRWVRVESTSIGHGRDLTRVQGTLLMVADGMGGHGGGDVASAVTLDSFVEHSLLDMPWLGAGTPEGDTLLAADFQQFVVACQARLVAVAERKDLPPKLGTTLTAAYVTDARMITVHVGDTRAYLLRGGALRPLTRDHTLGAQLGPTAKGADLAAMSHILVNAIGGNTDRPTPELAATPIEKGDRVLLCSDGLHGPVNDAKIAALLAAAPTPQAAVDALIAEALAAGGPDNVTAVVAFV